ncbi:MAG: hypothetical protein KBD60_10565, partial [Sterolibacterium sp.]|nr:hypothetical protein [Sterolibacterium sp.]
TASSRNSVVYVGFGNLFTSSSFPFLSDTMPAFLENEISGEAHPVRIDCHQSTTDGDRRFDLFL